MVDSSNRMAKMESRKREYPRVYRRERIKFWPNWQCDFLCLAASFPPTRLGIALMLFATTFVMYLIRVNLSISILGMVRTHKQTENETIKFDLPDVSVWHPIEWFCSISNAHVLCFVCFLVRSALQLDKFPAKSHTECVLLRFHGDSIDRWCFESNFWPTHCGGHVVGLQCNCYGLCSVGGRNLSIILVGVLGACSTRRIKCKCTIVSVVSSMKWQIGCNRRHFHHVGVFPNRHFAGHHVSGFAMHHREVVSARRERQIRVCHNWRHFGHSRDMAICCLSHDWTRMGLHILYSGDNCAGSDYPMDIDRLQFTSWTSKDQWARAEIHRSRPGKFRVTHTGCAMCISLFHPSSLHLRFLSFWWFAERTAADLVHFEIATILGAALFALRPLVEFLFLLGGRTKVFEWSFKIRFNTFGHFGQCTVFESIHLWLLIWFTLRLFYQTWHPIGHIGSQIFQYFLYVLLWISIGRLKFSIELILVLFLLRSAHIIPGILLFSLRFVGENAMYCVALITIALGLNGASTVVSLANVLDLSPNYAATLSSIINTFSTSAGIIAPLVVSYFTSEQVSWLPIVFCPFILWDSIHMQWSITEYYKRMESHFPDIVCLVCDISHHVHVLWKR